jgi:hypothetical protein
VCVCACVCVCVCAADATAAPLRTLLNGLFFRASAAAFASYTAAPISDPHDPPVNPSLPKLPPILSCILPPASWHYSWHSTDRPYPPALPCMKARPAPHEGPPCPA